MEIINLEKPTEETYKLFFGTQGSMLRIDKVDHPIIMDLFKFGFSNVWAWTAVTFDADVIGWNKLDPVAQRIFLLNNGYQTVMDSGISNVYSTLASVVTNTELKLSYTYINQNESIHAASYSYGLSQMFGAEAEQKINIVYEDEFIKRRMDNEVDFADELFDSVILRKEENKDIIFKTIVAAYALEKIKFPFSFFATWSINKTFDNAISGFSQLLKLIAQDEIEYHVPTNKNILRILKREKRQDFQDVWDENFIVDYVKKVAEAEKDWSDYLLSEGELPGFNHKINNAFIEYWADRTLIDLGLEPLYNVKKNDTIDWFNTYRKISNQNAALQEISNVSYSKGVVQNDILLNLAKLKATAGGVK